MKAKQRPLQKLRALEAEGRSIVEHIGALEGAGKIGAAHARCEEKLQRVIHDQVAMHAEHHNEMASRIRLAPPERRDLVGIPTVYAGTRYRSRLEARWACWFELMGIYAEYEPYDLNSYIPDFVIPSEWSGDLLVEVKPGMHARDLRHATHKIDASGWDQNALIVGSQFGIALEREPEPQVDGTWLWHPSRGLDVDIRRARREWAKAANEVQWKGING